MMLLVCTSVGQTFVASNRSNQLVNGCFHYWQPDLGSWVHFYRWKRCVSLRRSKTTEEQHSWSRSSHKTNQWAFSSLPFKRPSPNLWLFLVEGLFWLSTFNTSVISKGNCDSSSSSVIASHNYLALYLCFVSIFFANFLTVLCHLRTNKPWNKPHKLDSNQIHMKMLAVKI